MGHLVIVLSRALDKESHIVDKGFHVYRIRNRWNLSHRRFFWRFQRYLTGYRVAVAGKLDELVQQYHIDVVESPEIYADLLFYQLTRKARPAIVIKLHTPRWLVDKLAGNRPALWNRLEYLAERMTIKNADAVYSCSRALLGACEDLLPKRDYPVVYNPMAIPEGLPAREDNGKKVLFVGRLEWQKGVQYFGREIPSVLKRVEDARFTFLGPDSSWHGGDSLRNYILSQVPEGMRHALSFPGGVSRQEVLDNLRKASVVVLPSLWDNFPYTCLEAMACGCAVVGSKKGGMAEMMEDCVSGILVDPEKPGEISEAIVDLLRDDEKRHRLGQNAAKRIKNIFELTVIVKQTIDVYQKALLIHNRKTAKE